MENILGWNAVVAGLSGVLIGLVCQIITNWWRRSCEGLSLWWAISVLYSYASWLIYGICKEDKYLLIPQSLGTLCMITILFQFWWYRNPPKKDISDV